MMNAIKILLPVVLVSILIPLIPITGEINSHNIKSPEQQVTNSNTLKNIYIYNNFTINTTNQNIAKSYMLIFEGQKHIFLQILTNLSFENEIIVTKGTNLTIETPSAGYKVGICNSDFLFNGSLSFDGDRVQVSDSIIGNNLSHIRMYYAKDMMVFRNSTFRNLNSSKVVYRNVDSLRQSSQPISAAGSFTYSYIQNTTHKFPISEIKFKGNFSYNGSGIYLGMAFTFGCNSISNKINITAGNGNFESAIYMVHPVYLKSICNDDKIVNISMPYGSNLTIWKSSICFISNSTFNITGFSTNYIVLNDTHLVTLNSSFSANSLPFTNSGFYNLKKEGFLLNNGSELIMIGSYFSGNNLSSESPVITIDNSLFYFLPLLSVTYSMYHKIIYYRPVGIYPAGTVKQDFNLSCILDSNTYSYGTNTSIIIPAYKQGSNKCMNSIFSFTMFNKTQYFSISSNDIFKLGSYTYTKTYYDIPYVNVKTEISYNNSSIFLNISANESIYKPINVTYITKLSYDNSTEISEYDLKITSEKNYSYAFNIPRKRSLYYENIEVNSELRYFNTVKNVTEYYMKVFTIPPLFSVFILKSVNLSYGSNFSVYMGSHLYQSSNGIIEFRNVKQCLNVLTMNSGFMAPEEKNITVHPGLNYIKYKIESGKVVFTGTLSEKLIISVGNTNYEYSNGLSITLTYGNHTIMLNNSGKVTFIDIFVHSNMTSIYLYQRNLKPPIDWSAEVLPILLSSLAISAIYNISRKKLRRICPVCMQEVTFDRKHSHD